MNANLTMHGFKPEQSSRFQAKDLSRILRMSDGHLFLGARGGVDAPAALRWWFDAAHGALLLLSARSRSLRLVALGGGAEAVEGPSAKAVELLRFGEPPPVESARVSVDGQLVALQTSDIEVQVVHRATGAAYWVLCKPQGGNRILREGVLWSAHAAAPGSSQDLFLVTRRGLEQYRVSTRRRSCRLHRSIRLQIHAHWFEPAHGVLLVSAGKRGNELVPFALRGASVEKLPQLVFSSPMLQQDLFLANMYGELYAVYSDMRTSKLLLYVISRAKVACVRSLDLMLPPGTALKMSVVDNLLVCHSLDFNVSLFFDVRCEGVVNDPFSAPLPISMQPPGWHDNDCGHEPLVISESTKNGIDRGDSDDKDENEDVNIFDQQVHDLRRALSTSNLGVNFSTDSVVGDECVPSPSMSTPLQQSSSLSLPRTMTADDITVKRSDHHGHHKSVESTVDQSLFSRWTFLSPNFVLHTVVTANTKSTDESPTEWLQVRQLQVNLREICRSAAHHPEILPFLLRRGDEQLVKQLALGLVRDHIVEQLPCLTAITSLLACVQTLTAEDFEKASGQNDESASCGSSLGNADDGDNISSDSSLLSSPNSFGRVGSSGSEASRELSHKRRNAQGFIFVTQSDFFRYLWYPLLQDAPVRLLRYVCIACTSCALIFFYNGQVAKAGNISLYISEYVKNLRQNRVPVESIT